MAEVTEESMAAAIAELKASTTQEASSSNEAPKTEQPVSEKPAEQPKVEPKTAVDRSWEKLTETQARVRAQTEALKVEKAAIEQQRSQFALFDSALRQKNPIALLNAAGFGYQDVVEAIKGGAKEAAPKQQDPMSTSIAELQAKIQRLEEERIAEKETAARKNVLSLAEQRAEKFPLVQGLGAHEKALDYVMDYHRRTGELPGETIEDSLDIALEAVNANLVKEKERWQKVLTSEKPAVSVTDKAPESTPEVAPSENAPKTLSNSMTGQKPAPAPKKAAITPEDLRADALSFLRSQNS